MIESPQKFLYIYNIFNSYIRQNIYSFTALFGLCQGQSSGSSLVKSSAFVFLSLWVNFTYSTFHKSLLVGIAEYNDV